VARWCIGIDLGGTFIKFGLLDESNLPSGIFQLPTPPDRGPDAVIEQMITGGRRLLDENKIDRKDVLGVGIGAPGPLNTRTGVSMGMPNLPGFKGINIRARTAAGLDIPAVLENDANAAAMGEYLCGAGRGAGILVVLTVGTGIGSGIVIDGKILHGAHEAGAEIGHLIVEPGGEACGCGQRGCLERYCSATYTAEYATRLIRREKRHSSLAPLLETKGSIDAKDIQAARAEGDELAEEVWQRAAHYLAVGCVSICRILDPDKIVIGGGMAKAGDAFLGPMLEQFRQLDWKLTNTETRIMLAELGPDAGLIGAAGVARAALAG